MPLQTIDRGTPGNPSDTFKVGEAFDTCQANDQYLDGRISAEIDALTINTWADIGSTTVVGAGQLFTLAQHTSGGLGSGTLISKAGSVTDDGGTKKNSATGGLYLERIGYEYLTPEMFGVLSNGSTSDNAAIQLFKAASKHSQINRSTKLTSAIQDIIDMDFFGDGIFVDQLFRKNVIPFTSKTDDAYIADLVPGKHLRRYCQQVNPNVVMLGDSISTENANTFVRGDMLADILFYNIQKHNPTEIVYENLSIPGRSFADVPNNQYAAYIPWYTNPANTWIQEVALRNPHLVVLSFGMNGVTTIAEIQNVFTLLKALPSNPDIIVLTNLVPRPASVNATPSGEGAMRNRDGYAGLIRSYTKWKGYGLIDIHRKLCRVQDGFDPLSTVTKAGTALSPVALGGGNFSWTSLLECEDFHVVLSMNDNDFKTTGAVNVPLGTGATDVLQITGNATQLGFAQIGPGGSTYESGFVNYTFAGTNGPNLCVEKKGNWLTVYKGNDSQFGQYNAPIWRKRIVSMGGSFKPVVASNCLTGCTINHGFYITNKPSAMNSVLWNDETNPGQYGGSGWNHPSHWMGGLVYRPVIENCLFWEAVAPNEFLEGVRAIGSATAVGTGSNVVITTVTVPAGTWDVSGVAIYIPAASANTSQLKQGVTPNGTTFSGAGSFTQENNQGAFTNEAHMATPTVRFTVAPGATATFSLTVRATYTVGSMTGYGYIRAQRI